MIVYGLGPDTVRDIVAAVSTIYFDGNIVVNERRIKDVSTRSETRTRLVLGVRTSKPRKYDAEFGLLTAPGSRLSYRRHRIAAACGHAYGEVIYHLLVCGARRVSTGFRSSVSYTNVEDFRQRAVDALSVNAGSRANPVAYGELCECSLYQPYEFGKYTNEITNMLEGLTALPTRTHIAELKAAKGGLVA